MRILFMTNLYPSPLDPLRAPFNRHLVRRLAQIHPTTVIAPISWTDELRHRWRKKERLPRDRRVELDGVSVIHPRYYFSPRMLRRYYGQFYCASVAKTFRRVVAEFRPDVMHAPWAYPDAWASVRLGHEAGIPVLLKVHGSDVRLIDKYPHRRRGTVQALQQADGIVAVSKELATRMYGLGIAPDKIRVIYDGVNPELFCPAPKPDARAELGLPLDRIQILFVGNLVPIKGLDILLTACDLLEKHSIQFTLNIVGAGPMQSQLQAQARSLRVAESVRFHGPLPQQDLVRWYRAADLFVLPSRSEGVPNVLLEASACGTPWVATNVGGIPEISNIGECSLVPPEEPRALCDAIRNMLQQPSTPTAKAMVRSRHQTVMETIDFLDYLIADKKSKDNLTTVAGSSASLN